MYRFSLEDLPVFFIANWEAVVCFSYPLGGFRPVLVKGKYAYNLHAIVATVIQLFSSFRFSKLYTLIPLTSFILYLYSTRNAQE